ncbi:MAG: FecR family protein, partial [Chitinophagaceae bacterium]|nr:FecR family protein [Chitinophagaceae bacterium]
MNTTETIAQLLLKHLAGSISAEERVILDKWRTESLLNDDLYSRINDEQLLLQDIEELNPVYINNSEEKVWKKIEDKTRAVTIVHRVHFLKTAWFRYAAAILIIFGLGTIVYLWNTRPVQTDTAKTKPVPVKDILPGGQKATLTLADGSTIVLDSVANGQLAMQGISKVVKLEDGQLVYNFERGSYPPLKGRGLATFNTMSTPRGGQYQLTLSDGTKVWLNAASSITYPTAFNGNTREVKITGEVYFEVAKNKSRPFIVKTPTDEITVLGTEFNINAYQDETAVKTTLVEGSVKINNTVIKPGQAYSKGKLFKTNIQQDIAWKNGYFMFDSENITSVMRKISRWYNV